MNQILNFINLFKSGVARKVVSILFIFGIIPLCILTLIFFFFYINGQIKAISDVQQEIAGKISSCISAHLEDTTAQVELLGRLFGFEIDNKEGLTNLTDSLFDKKFEYESIYVADLDGNEILKVSRYYTYRSFELGNVATNISFKIAKSGELYIGPVEISDFSKFPQVHIAVPILDVKDKITGVLDVGVNVGKLWELISKYEIGDNRYAYIINSAGALVAYQDISSVLQKKDLKQLPVVKDFLKGKTGTFKCLGMNHEQVIGACSLIPLTGWGVVVEEPVKAAYGDLYFLSAIFLGISFITIFFAIIFGLKVSFQGIIKPIRRLQAEAQSIAKGDLDIKINIDRADEIGQLAGSFNTMVKDLKRTTVSRDLLVQEIAQRKRVEEDKIRLATVIEQAAEAVIITDKDANIQYVNPAFEQISGYSRQEVIGKTTSILESGRHDENFMKRMWDTISSGDIWSGRFINKKKNGSFYEMDATISPIKDKSGNIINYVSVQKDVTREVEIEKQLQQAQKMEAIGTLAGGIAHDFNNILAALIGYTELSREDVPEGSDVRDNLEEIYKAANRAKDLVGQILTFSRQDMRKRPPIKIHLIVKEALKLLRPSLPSTIEIKKEIPDTGTAMADPTRIHQLVMNLCTNAYHAMREAGGILTVELEEVHLDSDAAALVLSPNLSAGSYIRLLVSDTGSGIPSNLVDKIFDPYFTTKEKGEGTGLGLAVAHGIVKTHRGAITVDSTPGKGSVFLVYLPLVKDASSEVINPATSDPTGTERILFVDDEKIITDLEDQVLQRLGYHVTTCASGTEALEVFSTNPDRFDLVITDMTMPGMTGIGLFNKLISIKPDIPVILCTGFSNNITKDKAIAMGFKAFLMKPIDKNKLAVSIRNVLDNKR